MADLPTGPKDAHSTVLSTEEEAINVAFRKHRRCRLMIASTRFSQRSGQAALVAIDRISKFACTEPHQEAGKMVAAQFLRNLITAVPYAIWC